MGYKHDGTEHVQSTDPKAVHVSRMGDIKVHVCSMQARLHTNRSFKLSDLRNNGNGLIYFFVKLLNIKFKNIPFSKS